MKKGFRLWLIIISVIVVLISAVGCGSNTSTEQPAQNEYGFVDSGYNEPDVAYKCAYKLTQTEFKKSNVTIEFFYGHFLDGGNGTGMVIRVYLVEAGTSGQLNEWDKDAYFISEISGNEFLSNEYYCYGKTNEKGKTVWKFSHSETVKIPEEMFDKQEGSIVLGFREYFADRQAYGSGKSVNVNFRLVGDCVILSVPTK